MSRAWRHGQPAPLGELLDVRVAGISFLAWLNGLQPYFAMLDGFQGRRGAAHLTRVFELAAGCGALIEPELASHRMRQYLEAGGRP